MKAVIPAKASSTRVPDKNYRPFHDGKSLVDILIGKLLRVLFARDIYLSCEDSTKQAVADAHGIQFHLRDPYLCLNETPLTDLVRGICRHIPGDDPILWCECIDPLFDEHFDMLDQWHIAGQLNELRAGVDSIVAVHRERSYLLDQNHRPIGWGFGEWHPPSQLLPVHYRFNFACSILTRQSIQRCGYMIGANPIWFEAATPCVDIDTEEDFRVAQAVYAAMKGEAKAL